MAANLKGGEIIELISDLGGGKTTLVRGLARGAGSTDHVSSPTFTISKVYKTPDFDIYHFDFYRLGDVGIIEHELKDVLSDPRSVLIVEWGQMLGHIMPKNRMTIVITKTANDTREITLKYPNKIAYLVSLITLV